MSENNGENRHVSYEQVKCIIDFMGQHIEFATGNLRSLEARHTSKQLWGELTKILNSCRAGTRKTSDGWSKYWSDFKNKLKNKAWLLKRKKGGAALKRGIRPLSKLERRALVILGPFFEKKRLRTNGNQDILSGNLSPQVKLESIHEIVTNDYTKANSNSSGRLIGCDERYDGIESSEEECTDDNGADESLIQNLYPKWLIEVEKKRAEAELIRAKAEEQRADAASKSAEAALIQAETLKKLAEASTTQAEAIMRIALLLERRGHREDILDL